MMEIEVLERGCLALRDFYYENTRRVQDLLDPEPVFPVFREGEWLNLRQGGEAFFIYDGSNERFLYTTTKVEWLFEYLAFAFRVPKKSAGQGHGKEYDVSRR